MTSMGTDGSCLGGYRMQVTPRYRELLNRVCESSRCTDERDVGGAALVQVQPPISRDVLVTPALLLLCVQFGVRGAWIR